MTHLKKYIDFYSGDNRKEIFKQFYCLMTALRNNDLNNPEAFFTSDCIADISMTGHFESVQEVSKGLQWPGPIMDIQRITIWNFVARSHNGIAQQSAYVQCIYAKKESQFIHPFVFGGHFVNTFKKTDNGWKISNLKFDLMYESGNNSFVKDHWNLIDYGIFYGHKPIINAEIDSPWHVIPHDEEEQTDVEKIFETEFKLNFGMDGGNFEMTASTFTEDVQFKMSAHKNINKYNPTQTDGDYFGIAECNNFLKSKHHKEPRLQHTDTMGDIVIDGNEATAYMFRSEFNRIANQIYKPSNIYTNVNTVLHINKFRKIDDEWKLSEFTYHPVLDFVEVPRELLCYDDLICGGKKWSTIKI
ncbi:nuclear transport factor 2 family protein [Enterococcus hulanensis]|uniref:nuclear transport factor 2 family protein n=1 Tax=Enterococcus hulanensis TaxID=2559929 RepID=UPI001484ECB1|nr:nuclear transport factor 2 family protein [Enterococcus hulanensis]